MIFIRCDGNRDIALGHVQRCLSVGDALANMGCKPVFMTATGESQPIIEDRGFKCILLDTDYRDMEAEIPELIKLGNTYSVMGLGPHIILVDSYQITPKYMEALRQVGKVAYIDDMGARAYPVDVLINYDIHATSIPYGDLYKEAGLKEPEIYLIGCKYAPLRQEFCADLPGVDKLKHPGDDDKLKHLGRDDKLKHTGEGGKLRHPGEYPIRDTEQGDTLDGYETASETENARENISIRSILITTGGGDKARFMEKLPEYLRETEFKNLEFHMVIGPFVEEDEIKTLEELAAFDSRYIVHENVSSMAALMKQADLAITAGGSTLYELCALKVPAIMFTFADNQRPMAAYFNKGAGLPYSGDLSLEGEAVLEKIRDLLKEYVSEPSKAKTLSKTMGELVDGKGAGRIAAVLMENNEKHEGHCGR